MLGRAPSTSASPRACTQCRLAANLPIITSDPNPVLAAEESLAEIRELATGAGGVVIGEFVQRRPKPDPATLIGIGKAEELKGAVASSVPDVVIFDHELTPSQQRNLERELEVRVIDRTQLILDIFARHARTREGQLQVELAQLEVHAAAAGRTRRADVAARRRHRHPRSR